MNKQVGILMAAGAVIVLAIFGLVSRKGFQAKLASDSDAIPHPTVGQPAQAATVRPAPPGVRLDGKNPAITNKLFRTSNELWLHPIPEEDFARFRDWAERYLHAPESGRTTLAAEGVELARARRESLKSLVQSDPERALELAVPFGVRRALSASVTSLLEERVSGRGRLAVLAALPERGKEREVTPISRIATISEREFKAFVFGRRLGEPTRDNIPLNGIALDDLFAVSEKPLRMLELEEAADARVQTPKAICPISGQPSTAFNQEVVAEVGGKTVFLCQPGHVLELNDRLVAAESGPPGPKAEAGEPAPPSWTEGLKKLILIRVDFPDLTNAFMPDATAINLISNLNSFYTESSYGRAGFCLNGGGSDFTPTFRMTNSAEWYVANSPFVLRNEAHAAATAAGYTLINYDLDVICMGAVPFPWVGLAFVGGPGAWLRGPSLGVAAHELGHNLGLTHANFWDTHGTSVIGPGTSQEYGDQFDTMGSASAGNYHFNARYKNYLNWLRSNEVVTGTSNGTYRIYAQDDPNSSGIRGLRIVKNSETNYWVEFRQKFTNYKWLMNGAGLRWAGNGNQSSRLLDTTPGSDDSMPGSAPGKFDACIVIGRTFSDTDSGIHITPIGKGGTSSESLDVVVNLGEFPENLPPTLDFSASATNAATNITISFTATAEDPNGDNLAYYWDFGDRDFGTNSPTVSKSWSAAGEYLVRCVASDMKGGAAYQSLIVTIGSPTNAYRISGSILNSNASVPGVRVYVSPTRMGYSDSDGTYDIVGLSNGTYTVNASLYPYAFFVSGFTNPVIVGLNRTGIDFTPLPPPTITQQPLSRDVCENGTVTFNVEATGGALTYQWRKDSVNQNIVLSDDGHFSGVTTATLTVSNAISWDSANYSCVVSNVLGYTAISSRATLNVVAAPAIAQPLYPAMVAAGDATNFTVVATGGGTLGYQWQKNGVTLENGGHYSGVTTATLTISNATGDDAGNYRCAVTNGCSVNSPWAALTVSACSNPTLVNGDFEGATNDNGVAAGWTGYQRGPNPTTVWSIQTASPPDSGLRYQQIANTSSTGGGGARQDVTGCTIGNTYRIAGWMRGNSASATCTVKCSPTASTDWATAADLNPAQSLSGNTWTAFSGTIVAAGTNMTLWLDGQTAGSGLNKAECFDAVTVTCVSAPSPPPAPTPTVATGVTTNGFTANWNSCSDATGYRLDVSTNVSFASLLAGYQDLDVGNTTSRIVTGLSEATTYYYRLRACNAVSASPNSSTISVTTPSAGSPPPAPTANPATGVTNGGFTANWSSSSGALGYQLDVTTNNGFSNYASTYQDVNTGNVLNWSVCGLSTNLTHYYRVRAYNANGTSGNSGTIAVAPLAPPVEIPAITQQPSAQNVCPGATVSFNLTASGEGTLTYQWQTNRVNLNNNSHYSGVTSDTLNVTGASSVDAVNYRCVVSNAGGGTNSAAAALTLKAATSVTQEPAATNVCAGADVTFTVGATGEGVLTYQWQTNGVNVSDNNHYAGATTATLTVTNVGNADAANYRCVVTGGCGSANSSDAALTLRVSTAITQQPVAQNVWPGSNATFSVTAGGEGALSYQWRKNGVDLGDGGHYSGATTAALTIAGADDSDVAGYGCVVTAGCGSVTSAPAALSLVSGTVFNYSVDRAIPDGGAIGIYDTRTVASPIQILTGLKVRLKISGTFNGDLFCYVTHGSGYSVLLNRVGRRAVDSFGYDDPGLGVTFDDAAGNDAHVYRLAVTGNHNTPLGTNVMGSWVADGRTASPGLVLDTDARPALLNSFTNLDPNGSWTIFVADLAGGDSHTLVSWGLEITGAEAPPASGTIYGKVQLQGFTGVGPRTVQLVASDSGGVSLLTTNVSLAFAGSPKQADYVLSVPTNTVYLSAKTAWNLRRRQTVPLWVNWVATNNFTGSTGQLLGGDISQNNNLVNTADYTVLKGNWLKSTAGADLTGDGLVNTSDYTILKGNWLKTGDPQ